MIDLYTSTTGNGRRAAIALEECGLPYRVHRLDLSKGETQTAEFKKINPAGGIPVIVDGDGPGGTKVSLAQSSAIVLYCAQRSGKLLPADPAKRAEALQWFMQAITDVAPASSIMFYSTMAPDKSDANAAFWQERFLKQCGTVDAQLAGKDYIVGEFSVADVGLYPVIAARKAVIDAASGLANLKAWDKRMTARPGVAKAIAANG